MSLFAIDENAALAGHVPRDQHFEGRGRGLRFQSVVVCHVVFERGRQVLELPFVLNQEVLRAERVYLQVGYWLRVKTRLLP